MSTDPTITQGVITCFLAKHCGEALALGRSIRLNSPSTRSLCVVEGSISAEQERLLREAFDQLKYIEPRHYKMGWLVKHVMVEYTEFEQTLFLDSDCVVIKDLTPFFEMAQGRPVAFSTKASPCQEGPGFLYSNISLQKLMRDFKADWWPQILGGGHLYFERTEEARSIFKRALYWGKPDVIFEYGWTDRKKAAPDELTLQMALAELGYLRRCALVEYPLVCWTPWTAAHPDCFSKRTSHRDRETGKRSWSDEYFVAHFGGDADNAAFIREQWRLAFFGRRGDSGRRDFLVRSSRPFFHAASYIQRRFLRLRNRLRRVR